MIGYQMTVIFMLYLFTWYTKPLLKPKNLLQSLQKKKFAPVHAIKAYRQSGGNAPIILNLDISWRWGVSLMAQPLYHLGKEPLVLTE